MRELYRETKDMTYTNNEEDPCKDRGGHDVENCQEWTSHCSPNGHAHEEMADSLLYDCRRFNYRLPYLASILCLDDLELRFVHGQ
jgi:hypothetical protein